MLLHEMQESLPVLLFEIRKVVHNAG